MIKLYKSNLISLIFCGKTEYLFTPFYIEVDLNNNYINVRQKNWYLIGTNYWKYKFTNIRSIEVDNNIMGSNIYIKVLGNVFSIYGLKNNVALEIKDIITLRIS